MPEQLPDAWTQYTDLRGTAAIDFYEGGHQFHQFAAVKGIDTDRWAPFSFALYRESGPLHIMIYAVDKHVAGTSFDDFIAYARAHNGALPMGKFQREITLDELGQFVKRLSLAMHRHIRDHGGVINSFEEVETGE